MIDGHRREVLQLGHWPISFSFTLKSTQNMINFLSAQCSKVALSTNNLWSAQLRCKPSERNRGPPDSRNCSSRRKAFFVAYPFPLRVSHLPSHSKEMAQSAIF